MTSGSMQALNKRTIDFGMFKDNYQELSLQKTWRTLIRVKL